MKIVHVCLNKNGGAAAAAWRLHLSLLQSGLNSWFYTLEPRGEENPAQQWVCWKAPSRNNRDRIRNFAVRKYWDWKTTAKRKALHALEAACKPWLPGISAEMASLPDAEKNILEDPLFRDADIIHLHWVTHFLKYHEFFRRARNRYALCWTLHDLNPISGLFHYRYDFLRNPQTAALDEQVVLYKKYCLQDYGQPIAAIAPNSWMFRQLAESTLGQHFLAVEIPYCLPLLPLAPITRMQARQHLGIPPDQTILLAVAENTEVARKQTGLLLSVAQSLPDMQWEIVGKYTPGLYTTDNLRFRGFVKDSTTLQQLYTAADAVVIASAEDNLPNVLLEALACGTPVLSFAVGGMQQYVVPGLTGFTTPVISAEGLQQLILHWYQNRDSFDADAIRQYAQQHFDPQSIARRHRQLYEQMLQKTTS